MDRALYVAMTGAQAVMAAQRAVTNNIANASTTGFRAELHATEQYQVTGDGLPSRIASTVRDSGYNASQGMIEATGNPLDVAVRGRGWIAVQAPDGSEAYTRAGSLKITQQGQLVTASGEPVLGDGGPIAVPPSDHVEIAADGTVSIVPQGQAANTLATVGRLRVVDADDRDMSRRPDGLFRVRQGVAMQPVAGDALEVGALEGSNVNMADQLVSMIGLSRQFEMQVKVLHTAEENARAASTLLKVS